MNNIHWHPKHWPTYIGLGFLYVISQLPLSAQYKIGNILGKLLYRIIKSRRHIVQTNVRLCFPELSSQEQKKLSIKIFQENAIGFLEATYAWWNKPEKILPQADFHGFELVDEALAKGKGLLLIGAHFTNLELAALLVGQKIPLNVTYRKQKNIVMDQYIFNHRSKYFPQVIDRSNTRAFLKSLKKNQAIWYAPDQDYGKKRSIFAPFFNIPAATITGTSKLLQFNDSAVLFLTHQRDENNRYQITISKFDQHLPTGDMNKDALIINQKLEQEIKRYPAQYMWTHRRFKSRPDGETSLY